MTRRKKLKTAIVVLLVLLIVVPVAWRLIYGAMMERRWQAKLDELRAAGEPLSLAEMAPPEIPDEENAALLYEEAFAALDALPEKVRQRIDDLSWKGPDLPLEELEEGRRLLGQTGEVLRLLRKALKRPRARFPLNYNVPPYSISMSHLRNIQAAVRLLRLSSWGDLADGEPDRAACDCLAGLKLARSLHDEPVMISALVEEAVRSVALDTLKTVMNRAEVSADVLRQVLRLLGDVENHTRTVRLMKAERCNGIYVVPIALKDPSQLWSMFRAFGVKCPWQFKWMPAFILKPIILSDGIRYLDTMAEIVALAGRPDHQSRTRREQVLKELSSQAPDRRPVSRPMLLSTGACCVALESQVAKKGVAVLAVTLRLHRMKDGKYPETLSALVPEFLEKLPTDPFTGKDFIYRREGKGFIVYSVGIDRKDDGGVEDRETPDADDIVWKCLR